MRQLYAFETSGRISKKNMSMLFNINLLHFDSSVDNLVYLVSINPS